MAKTPLGQPYASRSNVSTWSRVATPSATTRSASASAAARIRLAANPPGAGMILHHYRVLATSGGEGDDHVDCGGRRLAGRHDLRQGLHRRR
jgi:hypothetical protein